MRRKKRVIQGVIAGAFSLVAVCCTSDELPPAEACDTVMPTYDTTVKEIIDQTCSYSGCHDGSGGIGPGDYSTYNGIVGTLQNGSFADRVITSIDNPSRGMPPDASVYPESQQDDLSEIQLEILTCWIQNGFPE